MAPSHPQFMFGRGYDGPLKAPKVLWKSDKAPREDHSCPKWLTATEFEDVPEAQEVDAHKFLTNSNHSLLVFRWIIFVSDAFLFACFLLHTSWFHHFFTQI